jgi:hypothetical protein
MTERQVDAAATKTRANLERLLNVVEAHNPNRKGKFGEGRVPRPLCLDSGLDFLADDKGFAIADTSKRRKYTEHIAICGVCLLKDQCLEVALAEKREYGIWGGTLPADRKNLRRTQ